MSGYSNAAISQTTVVTIVAQATAVQAVFKEQFVETAERERQAESQARKAQEQRDIVQISAEAQNATSQSGSGNVAQSSPPPTQESGTSIDITV